MERAFITTLVDIDRTQALGFIYGVHGGAMHVLHGSGGLEQWMSRLRQWVATLAPGSSLERKEMRLGCRADEAEKGVRDLLEALNAEAARRGISFAAVRDEPDDQSR